MGQGAQDVQQVQPVLVVQCQGGGQQGLKTDGAGRGLSERTPLVLGRSRGVGAGDDVDQSVAHRLDHRLPVGLGPQRRIQPVEGPVVADVDLVEAEVVDRHRGGDLQPSGPGAGQRFQRAGGRNLIHQEARAGLFNQSQIALQLNALGDGRNRGQAQPCRQFARGRHSALAQPRIGRTAGDQGVEGCGVAHDPLQGAGVGDDPVAVGEVKRAGLVHQADLGHALAVAGLCRRARCTDVDQPECRATALDVVDHRRIVDGGVGVGLDDDGRHPAGRGGQAGGLERLLGLVAGLAGLDPDVDQAGREAQAAGVHDLDPVRRAGRGAVDDLYDATFLDEHGAGAVIVGRRVQQAGVQDRESGHWSAPSRRTDRAASTAMRAATPIST